MSCRDTTRHQLLRFFVLCFLGFSITFAGADETRTDEIAKKKQEKSKHLAPYVPNKAEVIARKVEKALTVRPTGLYPFFGSVYTGGLLAAGPGYRIPYKDSGAFDIHGAWSIENYRMVDTSLAFPTLAYGTFSSSIFANYINAGKVPFYGLGNDTQEDDKTRFEYRPTSFGLNIFYNPFRQFGVGGGVQYLKVDTAGPSSMPEPVPGADSNPVYTVTTVRASFSWKNGLTYANRGGLYRFEWRDYAQHGNLDPLSFKFYQAEVNQFIPIFRANQVIALQGLVTMTDANDNNETPYYLMPLLGGSHYLRGYSTSRFRDRNRLLLAAEYRWTPSKFLDMVVFFEAGKVAEHKADVNLKDLHHDFGIGMRFHSPSMTALRIELAHSEESTRFIFTIGPTF